MNRRVYMGSCLTGSILTSGCLDWLTGEPAGVVWARAVEKKPPDIEPAPYPQEEYENEHFTKAAERAIKEMPNPATAEVPIGEYQTVHDTYSNFPKKSTIPIKGSSEEYTFGAYVSFNQHTIVLQIRRYT